MSVILEAAVDSLDDAMAAVEGGADRLELCAELNLGGTSPPRDLIAAVMGLVSIPVLVMIRPRGGSFVYSPAELDRMRRDIAMAVALGVDGLVLGVLDATHRVDVANTQMLVNDAAGLPVTFHRAIDRTADPLSAVDALLSLGVARVLTSGGAETASEGVEALRALVEQVGDRLGIVAGGGVRATNVKGIVQRSGVREVHARCGGDAERIRAIKHALLGRRTSA